MKTKMRNPFNFAARCLSLLFLGMVSANADVNVTQHHNHLSRDGVYIDPTFTVSNIATLVRDTAFDGSITGNVYAQPLYIEGGPHGRAVIIAVTESNIVYALDATTGKTIWQTNVAPPVPANSLPCGNLSPFGISGTPVVDLPSRALFFDAITLDTNSAANVRHLIFSLNVDTGNLNPGWPVDVNSNAFFGSVKFSSLAQGERGALTVIGTNLFVPYGGLYGDCGTYYGWLVRVSINNPTNVSAWATTARGGGAWSVGGVASDGTDPFIATGNTFGASSWGGGEAIVHLRADTMSPGGTTNYWTPTNWSSLDNSDLDIGGSGPLLVDVPGATPAKLVVALGKDGNFYLLNRTNLGGISAPITQSHLAGVILQAAVTYPATNGANVVFANNNKLIAERIIAGNPPTITNVWNATINGRGSPFVTTTDGTNNFIVWEIGSEGDQRLRAFDGNTSSNLFNGGGANELMTGTRRFNTGIAARGRIYVANDNKVYSFKLPGQIAIPFSLTNLSLLPGQGFQFSFTNTPGALCNVFGTTNLATPQTNWDWLGEAAEISPGQFTFADTNQNSQRYYHVSSP